MVITGYATSASQLEDGVDGVIVPMDNEGCAAGIAAVLRDERCGKTDRNTKIRDYTNAGEIEKIYRLLETYEDQTITCHDVYNVARACSLRAGDLPAQAGA